MCRNLAYLSIAIAPNFPSKSWKKSKKSKRNCYQPTVSPQPMLTKQKTKNQMKKTKLKSKMPIKLRKMVSKNNLTKTSIKNKVTFKVKLKTKKQMVDCKYL